MRNIETILFFFFVFSALGWLIELVFRSVTKRRIVNPGVLTGPYVPIYGFGAVVLMLTFSYIGDQPWYVRALVYWVVTSGVELATGEVLMRVYKKRWWDYTANAFNIRGHVCLSFSFAWIALAFVFELVLCPGALYLAGEAPRQLIHALNGVTGAAMTLDAAVTSGAAVYAVKRFREFSGADVILERLKNFDGGLRNRLLLTEITFREFQQMKGHFMDNLLRRMREAGKNFGKGE